MTDFLLSHNSLRTISHDSVEPDMLKRYSASISCLVAFLLRCDAGWSSAYKMSLTPEQTDSCNSLARYLKHQPAPTGDGRQEDDFGIPDYFEDNSDDDEDDPLAECLIEEEIFPNLRTTSVSQNEGEERVLNLLISLYTHLPSKHDGSLYSPLLRFIILSSHQHLGEWLPPRRITELFTILLFSGRQIMYALMQRAVLEGQGIRYTE